MRVLNTPIEASDLLRGEVIIATDAEGGVLYTSLKNGKETLHDAKEAPDVAAPIHFPPYRDISDNK